MTLQQSQTGKRAHWPFPNCSRLSLPQAMLLQSSVSAVVATSQMLHTLNCMHRSPIKFFAGFIVSDRSSWSGRQSKPLCLPRSLTYTEASKDFFLGFCAYSSVSATSVCWRSGQGKKGEGVWYFFRGGEANGTIGGGRDWGSEVSSGLWGDWGSEEKVKEAQIVIKEVIGGDWEIWERNKGGFGVWGKSNGGLGWSVEVRGGGLWRFSWCHGGVKVKGLLWSFLGCHGGVGDPRGVGTTMEVWGV